MLTKNIKLSLEIQTHQEACGKKGDLCSPTSVPSVRSALEFYSTEKVTVSSDINCSDLHKADYRICIILFKLAKYINGLQNFVCVSNSSRIQITNNIFLEHKGVLGHILNTLG